MRSEQNVTVHKVNFKHKNALNSVHFINMELKVDVTVAESCSKHILQAQAEQEFFLFKIWNNF